MLKNRVTSVAARRNLTKKSQGIQCVSESKKTVNNVKLLTMRLCKMKHKNLLLTKQNSKLNGMNCEMAKKIQDGKIQNAKLQNLVTNQQIENQQAIWEYKIQLQNKEEVIKTLETCLTELMQTTISMTKSLTVGKVALDKYKKSLKNRKVNSLPFGTNSTRTNQPGSTKVVQQIAPMVQGYIIHRPFITLERCNQDILQNDVRTRPQRDQDSSSHEDLQGETGDAEELSISMECLQSNLSTIREESEPDSPSVGSKRKSMDNERLETRLDTCLSDDRLVGKMSKSKLGRSGRKLRKVEPSPDAEKLENYSRDNFNVNNLATVAEASSQNENDKSDSVQQKTDNDTAIYNSALEDVQKSKEKNKVSRSSETWQNPLEGSSWMHLSNEDSIRNEHIRKPLHIIRSSSCDSDSSDGSKECDQIHSTAKQQRQDSPRKGFASSSSSLNVNKCKISMMNEIQNDADMLILGNGSLSSSYLEDVDDNNKPFNHNQRDFQNINIRRKFQYFKGFYEEDKELLDYHKYVISNLLDDSERIPTMCSSYNSNHNDDDNGDDDDDSIVGNYKNNQTSSRKKLVRNIFSHSGKKMNEDTCGDGKLDRVSPKVSTCVVLLDKSVEHVSPLKKESCEKKKHKAASGSKKQVNPCTVSVQDICQKSSVGNNVNLTKNRNGKISSKEDVVVCGNRIVEITESEPDLNILLDNVGVEPASSLKVQSTEKKISKAVRSKKKLESPCTVTVQDVCQKSSDVNNVIPTKNSNWKMSSKENIMVCENGIKEERKSEQNLNISLDDVSIEPVSSLKKQPAEKKKSKSGSSGKKQVNPCRVSVQDISRKSQVVNGEVPKKSSGLKMSSKENITVCEISFNEEVKSKQSLKDNENKTWLAQKKLSDQLEISQENCNNSVFGGERSSRGSRAKTPIYTNNLTKKLRR